MTQSTDNESQQSTHQRDPNIAIRVTIATAAILALLAAYGGIMFALGQNGNADDLADWAKAFGPATTFFTGVGFALTAWSLTRQKSAFQMQQAAVEAMRTALEQQADAQTDLATKVEESAKHTALGLFAVATAVQGNSGVVAAGSHGMANQALQRAEGAYKETKQHFVNAGIFPESER